MSLEFFVEGKLGNIAEVEYGKEIKASAITDPKNG